jgi:hypothetical protein
MSFPFLTYGQIRSEENDINKNIENVHSFINYLLDDIDKYSINELPEDVSVGKILDYIGLNVHLNIKNHQPEIIEYFEKKGIENDIKNITLIVIKTYVRKIKNQPLEIEEEIDFLLNFDSLIEYNNDEIILPVRKPYTSEDELLKYFPIGQHIRSSHFKTIDNNGISEVERISLIAEIVEHLDNGDLLVQINDILNPKKIEIEYSINDTIVRKSFRMDLIPRIEQKH